MVLVLGTVTVFWCEFFCILLTQTTLLCFSFPSPPFFILAFLIFPSFGDRLLHSGEFRFAKSSLVVLPVFELACYCCLSNEVEVASRQAEGRRFSHSQAVSMAPYDYTEMPWTSCPTHITGRLLEAFPTFRLGGLRVAIRERMPVVEDHEVRYEVVAAEEDVWIEESDEDDDDGSDQIAEESLGAVIDNVLVTLPVLPNPRFLVRMATQEAEDKSEPSSGENLPCIAMAVETEFRPSSSG